MSNFDHAIYKVYSSRKKIVIHVPFFLRLLLQGTKKVPIAIETISENNGRPPRFTWLPRATSGLDGERPDYTNSTKAYGSLKEPKLSHWRN